MSITINRGVKIRMASFCQTIAILLMDEFGYTGIEVYELVKKTSNSIVSNGVNGYQILHIIDEKYKIADEILSFEVDDLGDDKLKLMLGVAKEVPDEITAIIHNLLHEILPEFQIPEEYMLNEEEYEILEYYIEMWKAFVDHHNEAIKTTVLIGMN